MKRRRAGWLFISSIAHAASRITGLAKGNEKPTPSVVRTLSTSTLSSTTADLLHDFCTTGKPVIEHQQTAFHHAK